MMGLVLAAALAAPARAAWWVQDTPTLGSVSYFANDEKLGLDTGRGFAFELGHSLYSTEDMPGLVQDFSGSVSWLRERELFTAKALVYPERFGSQSEAASLTSTFLVNQDKDAHTQALLGLAYARQRDPLEYFDGATETKNLDQFAIQADIQQAYYKTFQFIVGGSWFGYDAGFDGVRSNLTTFNSADLAWMPVLEVMRPFVHYTGSIEFIRLPTDDEPVSFFAGYSFISFEQTGFGQSGIFGIDFNLGGGFRFDPSYNYFNPSYGPAQSYVSLLLRYSHE
jgi:hypothetical protein